MGDKEGDKEGDEEGNKEGDEEDDKDDEGDKDFGKKFREELGKVEEEKRKVENEKWDKEYDEKEQKLRKSKTQRNLKFCGGSLTQLGGGICCFQSYFAYLSTAQTADQANQAPEYATGWDVGLSAPMLAAWIVLFFCVVVAGSLCGIGAKMTEDVHDSPVSCGGAC